jgi:GNAT superfamily N-acetyltransferase
MIAEHQRLARALPDIPRWLETRGMLLSGECEVLGLAEGSASDYVVRDRADLLISVVGRPGGEAFREVMYRNNSAGEAICQAEDVDYVSQQLPGWEAVPATLHLLEDESRLPEVPPGMVRPLKPSDVAAIEEMPPDLKQELLLAVSRTRLFATIADGRPVSFCYQGWTTETLWDIAIDSLEPYRRRGFAALVVTHLIRLLAKEGLRPVWGAEERNVPSMGLARKLGFRPVDRLFVLEPPATA